ncbi:MAG: endonuclease, partial [Bacilli bacterium]
DSFGAFTKNSYPSLSQWAIDLYKKWSREDPVSQREIDRTNAIYKYQKNRNPFIDIPGLENRIW